MTINYKPQPGRALVINGYQGSGKTKMAESIAAQRGGTIGYLEFGPAFHIKLKDALFEKPSTLIIDGDPTSNNLADIKHLLMLETLVLRGWQTNTKIPVPLIIICTQDKHRWLAKNNRRFDVIDLP